MLVLHNLCCVRTLQGGLDDLEAAKGFQQTCSQQGFGTRSPELDINRSLEVPNRILVAHGAASSLGLIHRAVYRDLYGSAYTVIIRMSNKLLFV